MDIYLFCGILFIQGLSAIFNNDLCYPTELNITIKIDPSKDFQWHYIDLQCSNWNNQSVVFLLSPDDDVRDYFEFVPYLRQNEYYLQVNATSTIADAYSTNITVYSESNLMNIIPLKILITKQDENEIIIIPRMKYPIYEKLPPGEIIAEVGVYTSYRSNLTVHSDDMPEYFAFSTIENGTFNIETVSVIDLDLLQEEINRTIENIYYETYYYDGTGIYWSPENVMFEFTVKVSDSIHDVTGSEIVNAFIYDINDHTPFCKNSTVTFSRYGNAYDLNLLCTDDDYSDRTLRYNTTTSTCKEEFGVTDYGLLTPMVDVIPTKASCQYVLHVTDGEYFTAVNLTIKFEECPSGNDSKNQEWGIGDPGKYSNGVCPEGYTGTVRRYCTQEGYYEDPIYNCIPNYIIETLVNGTNGSIEAVKALDILSDVTSTTSNKDGTLLYNDITTVLNIVNILSTITNSLNESYIDLPEITYKYLQVVDNIIDEKSILSWNCSKQKAQIGAETVLETLDKFTEIVTNGNLATDIEIPKSNLYLKIAKITTCNNNIEFPDRKSPGNITDWTKHSMVVVKIPCSQQFGSSIFSGVVYRNLSKLLCIDTHTGSTGPEINAPVLSFSLFPAPIETLSKPIELIFEIYNKSLQNPYCTYWSVTDRTWTTDGCWLVSHNKKDNTVTCHCKQFGNFAVLMSPPNTTVTSVNDPKHDDAKDRDDPRLVCRNVTTKFSRYSGKFNLSDMCTYSGYSGRKVTFYTVTSTCQEELNVVENLYVEVVVKEIPTKTSCHYVLNASDGKLNTPAKLTIKFEECPSGTDYKQQPWEIGRPGNYSYRDCPDGYKGTVERYCTMEGYYEDPIYNCTSVQIMEILEDVSNSKIEADEALDRLSNVTSTTSNKTESLQFSDTTVVVNILSKITDTLNESSTDLPEITGKYLQVVDNIIDEKSISSWNDTKQKTEVGAEKVLETLDKFTEKVAHGNLTADIEVPKPNLYLKIAKVTTCDKNVEFPDRKSSENVAEWTKHSMDVVKLPCSQRTAASTFSGIVYRDPSKLFYINANNESANPEFNAPILSFSLFPTPNETLDEPIELTFDIIDSSLENPKCSYWSTTNRTWATDGCWLVTHNKEDNTVTCHCNHLTNFAILMSPSKTIITSVGVHFEALSTITLVGCIMSMICLGGTIIMFGLFWRYVRSSRTFIHINLSISLFIAYLIFVTGLEATENKDLCMSIAVFLQFFLLVAFFTMLVEGLNLAFIVLKPVSAKKPTIPLLIGAYVLAFIVTGVSLGVHFNDYIREEFCWLSVESGAVWSFIVPVILVIVSNIIIVIIVVYTMFGTASMSRKTSTEKTKIAVRNIIILTPTLGLSWIIGIFAVNEHTIVFQYLFAILNSVQGLLICLVHLVLNNKIRDALRNRYSRWLSSRSFSTERPSRNMKSTTNSTATSKV
ncbi:hypothetical protein ACF0H5_008538 [Mactra antiquata]